MLQNRKSEPLLMIQVIVKNEIQQKTLLYLMFSHKLHSHASVQGRKSVCEGSRQTTSELIALSNRSLDFR